MRHFYASTFMALHLHQFSAVVQKMHFFGVNVHCIQCIFSIVTEKKYSGTAHTKGAI